MLKKLTFIVSFLSIVLLGTVYITFNSTNNITDETLFDIPRGQAVATIAKQLEAQQLINSALLFKIYVRVFNKAQAIKAGEYIIPPQQSLLDILTLLQQGQSKQYAFTIIEGVNYRELVQQLNTTEFLSKTFDYANIEPVLNALNTQAEHPEGLFLADTYFYVRDTEAIDILKRSYEAGQAFLNKAWQERQADLPLNTPYEALILASIIEKETAVAAERAKIAGVFINRLNKRMRLQTDPTVIYGLGEAYDGDIKFRDLRTDTPYNTYTRFGLTPTPIAMPGKAAITAALNPETTDALYFVANGEGGHTFSKTLAEHEAAVQVYLEKTR